MNIIHKIFFWVEHFANTKYKMHALWWTAFTESSFFIVPPDVLILAIAIHKKVKPFYLAIFTGVASTLGGAFGYIIGYYFFDSYGQGIINFLNLQDEFEKTRMLYSQNVFSLLFLKAFTPIPYKIFTIAAGAFKLNLWTFLAASFLSRTLRFFFVAYVADKYGKKTQELIIERVKIFSSLVLVAMLLIFLAVHYDIISL